MRKLLFCGVAITAAALVMAGCAETNLGIGAAGPSATPTSSRPAPAGSAPGTPCGKDPTCHSYVSTSAKDDGVTVATISRNPLKAEFTSAGTHGSLAVSGPCLAVSLPVTITGTSLIIDASHVARTAEGCVGDKGQQFAITALTSTSSIASIDPSTQDITVRSGSKVIIFVPEKQ